MLMNFHLPKSTLLMLGLAFAGRERVIRAYGARSAGAAIVSIHMEIVCSWSKQE